MHSKKHQIFGLLVKHKRLDNLQRGFVDALQVNLNKNEGCVLANDAKKGSYSESQSIKTP
jgi:hypothetical protein